ncbi:ATP/GTP-binding protein [Streptomyces sp. Mg1]|nr:ATP/GTP-binding protein [Streptomyces sp. Mg1]
MSLSAAAIGVAGRMSCGHGPVRARGLRRATTLSAAGHGTGRGQGFHGQRRHVRRTDDPRGPRTGPVRPSRTPPETPPRPAAIPDPDGLAARRPPGRGARRLAVRTHTTRRGGDPADPRPGSRQRRGHLLPGLRPCLVPHAEHLHPVLGRAAEPLHPRQLVQGQRRARHGHRRDEGQADLRNALRRGAPLRIRPARELAHRLEPPGRGARALGPGPGRRSGRLRHAAPRRPPPAAGPAAGVRVPAVHPERQRGQHRARQDGGERDRRCRRPGLRLARRCGPGGAPPLRSPCRGTRRPRQVSRAPVRGSGPGRRPRGVGAGAGWGDGGGGRSVGGRGAGRGDERRRLRADPAGVGDRAGRSLAAEGLRRRRPGQRGGRLRAPLRGAGPARAGRAARPAGPAGAARHRGRRRPQSVRPPRDPARARPRRARDLAARRRAVRDREDPAARAPRRRVAGAAGSGRPRPSCIG